MTTMIEQEHRAAARHYFRILEVDAIDRSDPLLGYTVIGWKAYLPCDDMQLGEAWKNDAGVGLNTDSFAMMLRNAAWKLTIYSIKQKVRRIFKRK